MCMLSLFLFIAQSADFVWGFNPSFLWMIRSGHKVTAAPGLTGWLCRAWDKLQLCSMLLDTMSKKNLLFYTVKEALIKPFVAIDNCMLFPTEPMSTCFLSDACQ